MSKRVLIISSSLRANSNSETLAAAFAQGAAAAENTVETISLRGKNISFCKGCLACQKTGVCAIQDDAVGIVQKMRDADVLVFASPIYYYEMSGQLKTLLDRANPLYGGDYRFQDIYFLSTAADTGKETDKRAVAGLGGWIDCFERARLAGTVFAGGVNEAGEIAGHPELTQARELGKAI